MSDPILVTVAYFPESLTVSVNGKTVIDAKPLPHEDQWFTFRIEGFAAHEEGE